VITAEQKRLVQDSYGRLQPVLDLLGDIYYSRLFEVDPKLKHLLPVKAADQGDDPITVIGRAVAMVECVTDPVDGLNESPQDEAMKQAFQWTLRIALGPEFTPDVEDAWTAAYKTFVKPRKDDCVRPMSISTTP